jgi:hypothetical protein
MAISRAGIFCWIAGDLCELIKGQGWKNSYKAGYLFRVLCNLNLEFQKLHIKVDDSKLC